MEEVGDRNGGSPGGGLNPNAAAFTPPVAGPSSRSRNQTRNRQRTKKKASSKLQPREQQTGSALSRELEKAFYSSGGRSGEESHRQRQQRHQRDSRGKGRYRGRQNQDRVPAKFDKDLFVQANNRFLVSDAVDVKAYDQDPGKSVRR